jgi:hypothetical protein
MNEAIIGQKSADSKGLRGEEPSALSTQLRTEQPDEQ